MSQFAGWLAQRYKVGRSLSDYEIAAGFGSLRSFRVSKPIDQGLIAINSTYLEYVDRHFDYRGWAAMWGALLIVLVMAFAAGMIWVLWQVQIAGERVIVQGEYYAVGFLVLLCFSIAGLAYWMLLGRDVFRYQYYPIRFNRVTRMVHVFIGGNRRAISVPWNDVHFYIGRDKPVGPDEGHTYDLRGNVMRDGIVVHTFAVGSDSGGSPGVSLASWEMIKRFMESGPDALPFPPLQLLTSVVPSFRNAFIMHVSSPGPGMILLGLPLTLPWALSRYLTMMLCRKPIWPTSVLADCRSLSGQGDGLKAPAVFGRVKQGPEAEAMMTYWRESVQEATALDADLKAQIYGKAVV